MSSYTKLKKLDEDTLPKLKEGKGPADKCICNMFSQEKKGVFSSVKKAFKVFGKKSRNGEDFAANFEGNGIYSEKEVVKRKNTCGRCGCDDSIVLKHSYTNIRITTPDISSVCPCDTDCLPDKDKFKNNIKVTLE